VPATPHPGLIDRQARRWLRAQKQQHPRCASPRGMQD
jgi:hypothetical protein